MGGVQKIDTQSVHGGCDRVRVSPARPKLSSGKIAMQMIATGARKLASPKQGDHDGVSTECERRPGAGDARPTASSSIRIAYA